MCLDWIFLSWELVYCTQSSVVLGTSRGLNFVWCRGSGLVLFPRSCWWVSSQGLQAPVFLRLFGATFLRWRWHYSLSSFLIIFFCMSACKSSSRWHTSSRCLSLRNSEMICKLDFFGWELLPADRHALCVVNWLWVVHVNIGQLKICRDMVSNQLITSSCPVPGSSRLGWIWATWI